MSNPVVHFEVMGKNQKKLQAFYGKLFDWDIDASNPIKYGLVKAGKGGIGGGIGQVDKGNPGYATFYIQVKDVDAHLKKVKKLGGKVIVPTTVIPNMVTFALFADPEGHLVGLVKEESM